jgi:DNA-binding MarR family transcriptional regulator
MFLTLKVKIPMFKELNPLLQSELRLGIMSILISVEEADFVYLREKTAATAGNISVQIYKLSEAGYIVVERGFLGKRTRTVCKITEKGVLAFEEYVEALKSYLNVK